MCGRFAQTKDISTLIGRFNFIIEELTIRKGYNIAPGQDVAVILRRDDSKRLKMMRWGLIPFWVKKPPKGVTRINVRSETIAQKPSFRQSFRRRRCLVPADGYYEWKKVSGSEQKIPYFFSRKDKATFAFAGIWDIWETPDGGELYSFSIVTIPADEPRFEFHDRTPAILEIKSEDAWIDPNLWDESRLLKLLQPYPFEEMEVYEVSPLVNSPKNDSPDCVKKFSAPRQQSLF